MEKIIRKFPITYNLDWSYSVTIDQMRKDIDKIEKLGATHVEIEATISYDIPELTIYAVSERMETDHEYHHRISIENERVNKRKEHELKELARLKQKYPD